jgi:2-C-methyl-D-erythritol 4-phosphate cytidylyltransferase
MSATRFWCVVAAAGSSKRMAAPGMPKQYLPLAGRTVIEWSLAPLLEHAATAGVVVVLAADDERWPLLPPAHHPKVAITLGGAERADSVLAGLEALDGCAGSDDWVLVHDAARPCLPAQDLDRLIEELRGDEVGGLLAVPVVDTLKRADEANRVQQTVARDALWRALTPQMFRFGLLRRALAQASERCVAVTDEAQAVEALGLRPRLVSGDPDNIKITVPGDLQRAAEILISRSKA